VQQGFTMNEDGIKIVGSNKKAFHEYEILETFEAGLELVGSEVKSLRDKGLNFTDSYVVIKNGEAFIVHLNIPEYAMGGYSNHDPTRKRRLLLNKREIKKIQIRIEEKGLTVVPIKLYFRRGLAKLEIAIAKGKKLFEKRDTIREQESKREIQRSMKDKY
jgi:SsrA-binding protein